MLLKFSDFQFLLTTESWWPQVCEELCFSRLKPHICFYIPNTEIKQQLSFILNAYYYVSCCKISRKKKTQLNVLVGKNCPYFVVHGKNSQRKSIWLHWKIAFSSTIRKPALTAPQEKWALRNLMEWRNGSICFLHENKINELLWNEILY